VVLFAKQPRVKSMSTAMSVCHGAFGRAALYRLDKSLITHAHREGHLIFHVDECLSRVVVNDSGFDVDECCAAAVSPLEPHSFNLKPDQASVCTSSPSGFWKTAKRPSLRSGSAVAGSFERRR